MEARVEDVMSITTTFKDVVIGGALSITKAQMSKTTVEVRSFGFWPPRLEPLSFKQYCLVLLQDMIVKGVMSLKGVHSDRGFFTDVMKSTWQRPLPMIVLTI